MMVLDSGLLFWATL